jgi:poly(3-hydroxybutyrate) depolymerase
VCCRLAAELSDRIAAIAPVAGTLAIADPKPTRPVPVIHFHGTADRIVPFAGPSSRTPRFLNFKSGGDDPAVGQAQRLPARAEHGGPPARPGPPIRFPFPARGSAGVKV